MYMIYVVCAGYWFYLRCFFMSDCAVTIHIVKFTLMNLALTNGLHFSVIAW